ncbi:class IV adenylate cyclase [Halobellus rarus]|uniref:Class IV adenylate cyclase n=1 Tax=Halobellus rarus TaxID=1126237 RepID=A0ABD6CHK5_9EURY|nr:class IV adenylate cyclase [Halobellus rarus]
MIEVEVKLRAAHEAVRAALEAADAESKKRLTQVDTYYDAPHRDFAETDEALRVRRERNPPSSDSGAEPAGSDAPGGHRFEETVKVTYKGPLIDAESKTRAEHETAVADGDAAAAIFDGLGFEQAAVVEKEREYFVLDGYTVTLDRVDGLGEFVEVEAEASESADVESVRDGAFEVLRRLGLDPDEQIRTSYLGLLLEDAE